ncbi:condensation domain-containing protein [Mucilaginibacter pallidiroseus]|nr:condensation domain-containing protein [Mucilaginibacter pallidiroseus]
MKMNDNLTKRPLTPGEKIYWTLEQKGMIHFVTVAEIETSVPPGKEAWQMALQTVQAKHAALNYSIKGETSETVHFQEHRSKPIPLEIRPMPSDGLWDHEAEKELAKPFDLNRAPLLRVTILERTGGCAVLLTVNHSIGDGLSAAFLLREIVATVASQTTLSTVRVLGEVSGQYPAIPERTRFDNAPPILVQHAELGSELTSHLIARAGEEKTTVHSVFTAAVAMAINKLSPKWHSEQLGVLHPVSYRQLMAKGESFELLAGMQICHYPLDRRHSFWALVEIVRKSLENVRSPETLGREMQSLEHLFSSNPDTHFLYQTLDTLTRHQVLISNLGLVPADTDYGGLKLKAIYGPMVLPDHQHVQSFGITTLNGSLTITLTSRWPIDGLLEAVKEILQQV